MVAGLLFGLVAGIANGVVRPYDPNTMSYPVSPEEALQVARDWAGDANLELTLVCSRFQRIWSPVTGTCLRPLMGIRATG